MRLRTRAPMPRKRRLQANDEFPYQLTRSRGRVGRIKSAGHWQLIVCLELIQTAAHAARNRQVLYQRRRRQSRPTLIRTFESIRLIEFNLPCQLRSV